jgi:hypothetical protein
MIMKILPKIIILKKNKFPMLKEKNMCSKKLFFREIFIKKNGFVAIFVGFVKILNLFRYKMYKIVFVVIILCI